MDELKVGDKAQLKSGGPVMTVVAIEADAIKCTWFEGKKKPHEHAFPRASLRRPASAQAMQAMLTNVSSLNPEEKETLLRLLRRVGSDSDGNLLRPGEALDC
jgi:uncharacterized protein YodC (DUF2158 family)